MHPAVNYGIFSKNPYLVLVLVVDKTFPISYHICMLDPWTTDYNGDTIRFHHPRGTSFYILSLHPGLPFFWLQEFDADYGARQLGKVFIPKQGWGKSTELFMSFRSKVNALTFDDTGVRVVCTTTYLSKSGSLLITENPVEDDTVKGEITIPASLLPQLNDMLVRHGMDPAFCKPSRPADVPNGDVRPLAETLLGERQQ